MYIYMNSIDPKTPITLKYARLKFSQKFKIVHN